MALTLVLVETGQMECKPGQVRKGVTRLASLPGMGTKMRRGAASSYPSLRVVTGTETVQIPNRRQRTLLTLRAC